jgi:hypothetical protein
MTPRRVHEVSLRPDRLDVSRLLWALAISIAVHLLCYGTYRLGERFNLWEVQRWPVWLQKVVALTQPVADKVRQPQPPELREVPLMFVDVNPQLAIPEPPRDARFYSDRNSEASNPDMDRDTGAPKITGKQEDIVKAQDVDRSKFDRLQPAVPQPQPTQEPEVARPRTPEPVGDLVLAKPETESRTDKGTVEQARPRTIQEAKARQTRNQLMGERMKQEGGVRRLKVDAGFDVKATPLGAYDLMLIQAVEQQWQNLLDQIRFSFDRHGRVVVSFRLHYDGRITDAKVIENTADDRVEGMLGLLCQKAITDPSPYPRWPAEVRRDMDKDYRDCTFTFYYR